MNLSKYNIVLFLAVPMLLGVQGIASSCSCLKESDPVKAFERAELVITGKIVDSKTEFPCWIVSRGDTLGMTGCMVRWTIEVSQIWKGEISDSVYVYASGHSSNCGFWFKTGRDYLIYGRIGEQRPDTGLDTWPTWTDFPVYITSSCERTTMIETETTDTTLFPDPIWSQTGESSLGVRPN